MLLLVRKAERLCALLYFFLLLMWNAYFSSTQKRYLLLTNNSCLLATVFRHQGTVQLGSAVPEEAPLSALLRIGGEVQVGHEDRLGGAVRTV